MKKIILGIICVLVAYSSTAYSDLDDCNNLYVGRIWIEKGYGLRGVVFLTEPSQSSGSYWVLFTSWESTEMNAALSTLMAAKMAQHRVNVITEFEGGCGIKTAQHHAKSIYLATQP